MNQRPIHRNICPNKDCFGYSGKGHGSNLKVWIEYASSDCYHGYDDGETGKMVLGGFDIQGNVRRKTGKLQAWCAWCNERLPDELAQKELGQFATEGET